MVHNPLQRIVTLDVSLAHLILRCGVTQPRADRRLNGLLNSLAMLARHWRLERPIEAARELRMTRDTARGLVEWVTAMSCDTEKVDERLLAFRSGVVDDASVPDGWIRMLLDTRGRS